MRATKGLWAALGAGVSLAAAGLIALATLGVVLAVGGWPNGHYVARDGSATLHAERAAAPVAAVPVVAAAHPQPAARPARHASSQRVVVRRTAQRHNAVSGPGSAQVTAPKLSSGGAPSGGSGGSTTVSTPAAPTAPVTKVTGTVGGTVTDVTNTAGQILDPVSPPVASTVTTVGQQAGQTIDQVGQTVGGVVGGLTGGN